MHTKVMTGAPQFSLSDALTAEVMVAARKLSVASAKAAAEIYTSVSVKLMIFAHLACIPVILQDTSYDPATGKGFEGSFKVSLLHERLM